MDFIASGGLILVVALAIAFSTKHPLRWAREEWARLWADELAPHRPGITGGTINEPRVKKMDERMRAYAKRLRREGRHLVAGKQYIPALTKPAEPAPPKAAKVHPIRKPTRINTGD